ncbi:MAG: hypothetical protein FJ314_02680 [SAR202 cluster bacterium]|nr:hypothetical protein [SAR202 cluster bacterium]
MSSTPPTRILPRLLLSNYAGGFGWEWTGESHDLEPILGPVLVSARALLASGPVHLLQVCADENGCGWLILDTTRNRSRRRCDMKGCRSLARLRRFSRRRREGGAPRTSSRSSGTGSCPARPG